MEYFNSKKILIIGGTGTLGQELLNQLLSYNVHSIRIYARHEENMFWMKRKYVSDKVRYLLGDIRDKDRLNRAYSGIDIVINCAALKHVSLCSGNPFESVKTNVIGTQNAIECAIDNNVKMFVQISTDKAVNPISTYGYTKALAENLVLEAHNYKGECKTKFLVIRSGNIMNSSGSCFQIWDEQYKNGIPLTITDLKAERYMATKEKISNAILTAINDKLSGLCVLFMSCWKLSSLLERYPDAKLNVIGLQPGEKLIEILTQEGEKYTTINIG